MKGLIIIIFLTVIQIVLIMIPIISTVTIIVTIAIARIRIKIIRKTIVFPQINAKVINNTYNRVKHKQLRSLKIILIQMMIVIMIILAMVAIIILIHLTMKITYDVSITQEIHCSYLGIVLSKTLI